MSTLKVNSIEASSGSEIDINSTLGTVPSIVVSNLNVSGVVTATSFSGSGANLTGVAATSNISTNAIVNSGVTTVAAGTTAAPSISPTGDSDTGIFFPSADTIAFGEGGSEAARIDSSGRLLVGTSTSTNVVNQAGLQIQGTGEDAFASFTRYGDSSSNNLAPGLILGRSGSSTKGTNTIVASGNALGFLHFAGANGSGFDIGASIKAEVDGTPGANDMPGRLVFSTTADGASSPTERMRIKADGYIRVTNDSNYSGIIDNSHQFYQSASQWTTFHVNGNASPYGIYIRYTGASPNGTSNQFLTCYDSGSTERASIRSNGGLANYSANNANLSDRNAKKDISPAANTWDCIKEWEIVNYRYKDQPDDADLNLGVIAQQVLESCPEVITVFQEAKEATEDQPAQEERLGVKEQQMYWMAIKALQEAQVRIEQLEAKVAALESA